MRAILIATGILIGACGGGSARSLRIDTNGNEGRVEAGFVDSCTGIQDRVFEDAVDELLTPDERIELANDAEGSLAVRVVGDDCMVRAFACVSLNEAAESVRLAAVPPRSLCRPGETCSTGSCIPEDTGAAIEDSGLDAQTDAERCVTDCLLSRTCIDGTVVDFERTAIYGCENIGRPCPTIELGTCPMGCSEDRQPLHPDEGDWRLHCAGSEERIVGDPCEIDDDCQPPRDDRREVPFRRMYLACDGGRCAETDAPNAPDLGEGCVLEALPEGRTSGVIRTESCGTGVCRFSRDDTCTRHECTMPCENDWDCPPDLECAERRDWTDHEDGAPRVSVMICQPPFGGWTHERCDE